MSHLPEMELPPAEIVVEPVTNHIPDNIDDAVIDDPSEEELIEDEDEDEEPIVITTTKSKLSNDDVFATPKVKPVKMTREEGVAERRKVREAAKLAAKEQKLQDKLNIKMEKEKEKARIKAERPKKQMSPEHLQKLQEARKVAAEKKKRNKELASQGIDIPDVLKTKSEKKREVQLKQGNPVQSFTKEDLAKAQFEAIENYEKLRKVRKAKKKVDQEEKQKLEASQNMIRSALGQPTQQQDVWDVALAGMWTN